MSSQGRGSAVVAAVVALVCLSSVLNFQVAQAKVYRVGGQMGWAPGNNFAYWLKRKSFYAGDKIVFKYDAETHNVAVVSKANYHSCTAPRNATTYHTGNDHIKLGKGHHFFICSFFDHCKKGGLRIAVKVV